MSTIEHSNRETMNYILYEEVKYDYLLPSYAESKRSPRCEEDISNPAPTYGKLPAIQSGADKLAEWFTMETRRIFRKG